MLTPLKYLKLIKNDVSITAFSNNKIYLSNFTFRFYDNKIIKFVFSDNLYSGIIKTYQTNDNVFHNYIEIDAGLNLNIDSNSTISIFSTFDIDDEESDLITLQDIHNKLIANKGKYTGYLGKLILEESGKFGLLNYFDKSKLDQSSLFVLSSAPIELSTNYTILANIKKEIGAYYEFQLAINSEILKFKVTFDINNNIVIDSINCSLSDLHLIEFQFVENTFSNSKFIELRAKTLSVLTFSWGFSTPTYLNNIIPAEVAANTFILPIGGNNSIIITKGTISATTINIVTTSSGIGENIISDITLGSINAGDIIEASLSLSGFIKKLLKKIFYPTFVAPYATLTVSGISGITESGTIGDILLSLSFNRGSILGKVINSVWNATTLQDYRSGIALKYIINNVDNGLVNTLTLNNQTIIDGNNNYDGIVNYSAGSQPIDSSGQNYNTPLVAGSINKTTSIVGYRKCFYGHDSVNNTVFVLSSEVRALPSFILNPLTGITFNINIPTGAKKVVIAYPSTIADISSILYVEGLNAQIKSIFNKTEIFVEGANGYSPISYKIFTYIPAIPFTTNVTYAVTL